MASSSSSSSSPTIASRLLNELRSHRKDPNPAVDSIGPVSEDNLLHWHAVLRGAEGTEYEGGKWKLDIKFPDNYPMGPPDVKFITSICHPNIHIKTGEICLDLLKDKWTPTLTVSGLMTAIQHLLTSPEPDSPLNVDAAAVLRAGDKVGYESLVRVWCVLHAGKPPTLG